MDAEIKLSPELTNALKVAIADAAKSIVESEKMKRRDNQWPEYLNKGQACKYLGVSYNTLQKWTSEKIIPYKKIGGVYRFSRNDLDKFMEIS